MTTNEPTTGEIVLALRFCYEGEEIECYECPCRVSGGAYLCHMDKLADRLESQEQENLDLRESVKNYIALTEDLREQKAIETARAEQAGNTNEWRYALMKLINENPEIKCTSICDGECMDCATSASGTARGFRLKKDLRGGTE